MSITSTASYTDSEHCPLCQQDNQCAVAAGSKPSSCWCMTVKIDKQAQLQASNFSTKKRCLCQQCGRSI